MSKHNTILKYFRDFTNLIKDSIMIYLNICLDSPKEQSWNWLGQELSSTWTKLNGPENGQGSGQLLWLTQQLIRLTWLWLTKRLNGQDWILQALLHLWSETEWYDHKISSVYALTP